MGFDTEALFSRFFWGVGVGGKWGLMFLFLLHRTKEVTNYDAILIFYYFLSAWWACTRAWYAGNCWKNNALFEVARLQL